MVTPQLHAQPTGSPGIFKASDKPGPFLSDAGPPAARALPDTVQGQRGSDTLHSR